jgi:uncharacterized protein YndB with AHSA1/START domain
MTKNAEMSEIEMDEPIVIERSFNAPVEEIWQAITDKDEMKKWYFNIPEFKPEAGCGFQFTGGPDEGPKYLHLCKVTEVVPGNKISYSWRYEGYPGISFVTWELFNEDGKTKLRLTHAGLSSFGTDNHDFARENFVQGWTGIVGSSLKEFVEHKQGA